MKIRVAVAVICAIVATLAWGLVAGSDEVRQPVGWVCIPNEDFCASPPAAPALSPDPNCATCLGLEP